MISPSYLDMVGRATFGDARSDIVSALALIMGRDKAEAWMRSLESKIREEAGKGAQQKVLPLIIGAAGIGTLGLLVGLIALKRR